VSDGELEGGVGAECSGVVGGFLAGGELIDTATDQVEEGMLDAFLPPGIVEASSKAFGEPENAVELAEQQEANVGGKRAAGAVDVRVPE
jgi:hypothetical protein